MTTLARGPELDPHIAELTGATLVELLDRAVARTPDREALVLHRPLGDLRWTYRELGRRSGSAAAALAAAGVVRGDRVVTWGPNDPWLVAALFGAWRLGAVVVPLDLRMADGVALRIAGRTEPVLVLAAASQAEAAAGLGAPVLGLDAATLGEEAGHPEPPPTDVTPDDIAEIVFTSGTSSDPKGVVLTHGQVIHDARMIAQTGMGRHPDRGLGIIPLSHMYGQIVPLYLCLISGSTLVFVLALTPTAIGTTLRRERITAITAVPQLIRLLHDGIEAEAGRQGRAKSLARARRIARWLPMSARRRLFGSVHAALGGHLEVITSGGAFLPPELQDAWERMGVRIVQGYGGTECAAITGHSRASRRRGTVGAVLAGLEVRIADDGELLVRGPAVMRGYWRDPDATAEVLSADGWLASGDAARIDAHGEIVILGRTRDRIALPNGLKVYPDDLEAALTATEPIRAAVAFEAAPGRIVAVLVPADPDAPDAVLSAAVKAANATLAAHQRIASWRRWPDADLPRTHTLKVRRAPVRDWFLASGASAGTGAGAGAGSGPSSPTDALPGDARRLASLRAVLRDPRGAARGGSGGPTTPGAGATVPDDEGTPSDAGAGASDDPVARICAILSDVLAGEQGSPASVTPDQPLADLALDSLARVAVGLRIEEAFDANLSDEELAMATDARELAALVANAVGRPTPKPPSTWAYGPPARLARRLLDASLTPAILRLIARPRVVGREHLEALDGPVLLCPNHTSHLDVPCVRFALPRARRDRTAVAAAADYFFTRRILGSVVSLAMGAFPFGRTNDVRASLERVADLLGRGWSVLIFPEGTRSPDGRLGPMRDGIGLLATGAAVPVVPIHVDGAHAILPKGRSLPRRRRGARVTVRFGAPLRFAAETPPHEIAASIGAAIAALAADAAAERAAPGGTPDDGTLPGV